MTLLELLAKAAGASGPGLIKLLEALKAAAPDLADQATEWIARLEGAISPSNLADVGAAALKELSSIAAGKLDGRHHPSDL